MANIYVSADEPLASDSNSKADAATVTTALKTIQQAGVLAEPGDVILVIPATVANASDTLDTSLYVGLQHFSGGSPALTYGDNAGNAVITVRGVTTDDVQAKTGPWALRGLKNWLIDNLQIGYDIDSGDDNLTIGEVRQCAQLTFTNVVWTGGCNEFKVWDDILIEDCTIRAPLSPFQGSGNRFLDGSGIHIAYTDNNDGTEGVGPFTIRRCHFEKVQGEDAIQAFLGGVGDPYADALLVVEDCSFFRIEGLAGFHTDSIQILGGTEFIIRRNTFFSCDDAMIASDFHNGKITFENNLCVACGIPLQGQGTDEWIIRNNTFLFSFFNESVSFGGRTAGISQKITMVNNILEDYGIGDDVIVDPASNISNNLVLLNPGFGDNLDGVPEFGTTARMDDLPTSTERFPVLPPNYELANDPTDSPGIGQGVTTTLTADRLGRTLSDPPDVGCHQSDPGTLVTPTARAPYLVSRTPAPNAIDIALDAAITATLFPVPGQTIDAATVTTGTFYVTDPKGVTIPASVTTDTEAGVLTVDVDGDLYPYVEYLAHLGSTVADTEGSTLGQTFTWTFRILGPYPDPAVGDFAAPATALTPSGRLKPPFLSHEPLT